MGHQILEHNLNSVLPYFNFIITSISTTWYGNPFYLWWWTLATISVWGTEILQVHVNRQFTYPPQITIYPPSLPVQHISSAEPWGDPIWHNTLMMRAGVRCVVVAATPPSSWDVPAIAQPQGTTEEFSDTFSSTREQTTPHNGGSKQKARPFFLSDANTLRLTLPVPNTNMTTQQAEYPRQHTAELPWQHIVTQVFQMTYCRTLDAFSLCKWLNQINKHHVSAHFYMRRNIHRGAHEDTSIRHLSSIQAQRQTDYRSFPKAFYIYGLWCSVFPCTFLPNSLLICAVLVLFLRCFIFPFLHWPIVMPLTPPVWCRFGSVCLWTDSPLSNGANVLLCGQSTVSWKWASLIAAIKTDGQEAKTENGRVDVLFSLVVGMQGRKEARKDWRGRMSWGWSQRFAGSILAEDCPLPAHCVPCFMCGAVSTEMNK